MEQGKGENLKDGKLALERINQRLVAHLRDLLDELLHIGKLAVHGHVADVGDGIDGVKFFNHFLTCLSGKMMLSNLKFLINNFPYH